MIRELPVPALHLIGSNTLIDLEELVTIQNQEKTVNLKPAFSLVCCTDIDTRRRAACDLVRGLCKFFEGPVTGIFSGYVSSMLQEYAKNPSVNWKHKDAAIYLVTSLASKAQTQKVVLALQMFLD